MGVIAVSIKYNKVCTGYFSTTTLSFWLKNLGVFHKRPDLINLFLSTSFGNNCGRILEPKMYGIVIIDYDSNHILNMQNYTYVDYEESIFLSSPYSHNVYLDAEEKLWNKMIEMNKIGVKQFSYDHLVNSYDDNNMKAAVPIPFNGTYRELCKFVYDYENDHTQKLIDTQTTVVKIDMSPMTVIEYKTDNDGAKKLLKKLKELNFKLTDEEISLLTNWRG